MTTDIRHLIDKYFEGDTSSEEEIMIREYFNQEDLPADLKVYQPIFRFLDDESIALAALNEIQEEPLIPVKNKRPFITKLQTIAAVAAVLLVLVLLLSRLSQQTSTAESYVWVDGKQITDLSTVQKYAESSFGKVKPENDIIKEQLEFVLE